MAENSKKKGRGDNFTFEDTQRLMKLAKKYAGIIECKKTDKYSWKQKNDAWNRLAQEYNAGSKNLKSAASLQSKFKNMKRDFRVWVAKKKQSLFATGGGPMEEITPYPFVDDMEALLSLSANGLVNKFDSDGTKSLPVKGLEIMEDEVEGSEIDDNTTMTPPMNVSQEVSAMPVLIWEDSVPCSDALCLDASKSHAPMPVTNWSTYSPYMLKQPLHKALVVPKGTSHSSAALVVEQQASTSMQTDTTTDPQKQTSIFRAGKNRPSLRNFATSKPGSVNAEKYSALAATKKELATLQIQILTRELEMKEERHKKELELLDLKIKSEKLDIQKKMSNN